MSLGRYHGFPDVQPWDRLFVIELGDDADDPFETLDLFEEIGVQPRGFILSNNITLECTTWGAADPDTLIIVPFPMGNHFGSIRKLNMKGVGSNTTGSADSIAFFV